MSNAPTMTTHTATDCMARCYGTCERVHVGDVVRVVVGPQLGYLQVAEVVAIGPTGLITVRFPDGVAGMREDDLELSYTEDELENTSA